MSHNELYEKINFVSNRATTKGLYLGQTLEEKIRNCINYYKQEDFNYDFQNITLTEQFKLLEIFNKYTICFNSFSGFEHTFENCINLSILESLRNTFSFVLYLQVLSDRFNRNYNHNNEPNVNDVKSFFSLCNNLFDSVDFLIKSIKKVIDLIKNFKKQMQMSSEYKCKLKTYIELFHEIDAMLETVLLLNLNIQNNYISICFIYDQFEYEIISNAEDEILKEHLDSFNLYISCNNLNWDYARPEPMFDIRKEIQMGFYFIQNLSQDLLWYKTAIGTNIINSYKMKTLSKNVYDITYSYFSRFFDLILLKNELENMIKIGFTNNKADDYFYSIQCYEASEIPIILRDCHRFILPRKVELSARRGEDIQNASTEIVKKYNRNPNRDYELLGRYDVFEVRNAIKFYIMKHVDEFFPEKFRKEFYKIANSEYRTVVDRCNKLISEFQKIKIENQSRICYIFDQLLEISKEDFLNTSVLYIYSLIDTYGPFMLQYNTNQTQCVLLFRNLFDLYRSGRLLIPDFIIRIVTVVEGHVCYNDFKYTKSLLGEDVDDTIVTNLSNFISRDDVLWGDVSEYSIGKSFHVLKNLFNEMQFQISDTVKLKLYLSKNNNSTEIQFNDNLLIEAFYHIPKPHRVLLSYIINHLARISCVDFYIDLDYIELLSKIFSPIIFKYKHERKDPHNLNLIIQKSLKRIIILFLERPEVFDECQRELGVFLRKYEKTDLKEFFDDDLIPNKGLDILDVHFEYEDKKEVYLYLGNILTPYQTRLKPIIDYVLEINEGYIYKILMINYDACIKSSKGVMFPVHLLGKLVDNNVELKYNDYSSVKYNPPIGNKFRNDRYVILLYKTRENNDNKIIKKYIEKFENLSWINLTLFSQNYELIALNFFRLKLYDTIPSKVQPPNLINSSQNVILRHKSNRRDNETDEMMSGFSAITSDQDLITPKKTASIQERILNSRSRREGMVEIEIESVNEDETFNKSKRIRYEKHVPKKNDIKLVDGKKGRHKPKKRVKKFKVELKKRREIKRQKIEQALAEYERELRELRRRYGYEEEDNDD